MLDMHGEDSPPITIFGIKVKAILIVVVIGAIVLVAVNRSEIESLLQRLTGADRQQTEKAGGTDGETQEHHLVVDQEMLTRAMQEVQVENLKEIESGDSSIPTDRFFFVVELVSGGDLEGIDLTIEPDSVTLVSEGGTETTIPRTSVRKIHRFKLPPSTVNEQTTK